MVNDLLNSSGLTEWVNVVAPAKATAVHLTRFHDEEYIRVLRQLDPLEPLCEEHNTDNDDDDDDDDEDVEGARDEPSEKRRKRAWQMSSDDLMRTNPLSDVNSGECNDDKKTRRELEIQFGLEDDCSPFAGHFEYRLVGLFTLATESREKHFCRAGSITSNGL
jgi:hypothetical protein